jgi:predicted negative regulator of RcsB-dependent stress response
MITAPKVVITFVVLAMVSTFGYIAWTSRQYSGAFVSRESSESVRVRSVDETLEFMEKQMNR